MFPAVFVLPLHLPRAADADFCVKKSDLTKAEIQKQIFIDNRNEIW